VGFPDQHFLHQNQDPKLERPSTDPDVVNAAALAVLDLLELDRPIRLLGARLELARPIPRCAVLPTGGLLP
jgi:hypothetical protein